MPIERARKRAVQKPWGSLDLRPWHTASDGIEIGEVWYERDGDDQSRSQLLLKFLATKQQLSIQVHPDDSYAQTMGLPRGKSEAWYVVSAEPGAKVAIGLKKQITSAQLRQAIDDGSIAGLVHWHPVVEDDVVFVPAGTIHAIGAGLEIVEIQQRSDATFRLFDFGRGRELHAADGAGAAHLGPVKFRPSAVRYTNARELLIVDPHFVFERVDLMPYTDWDFRTDRETWILVLRGHAQMGPIGLSIADVVLVDDDQAHIGVGDRGLSCVVAYPGPQPIPGLLRVVVAASPRSQLDSAAAALQPQDAQT